MTLMVTMVFAVSTVSTAFAASVTCTVDSVDGSTVAIECGNKASAVNDMGKVKVGKAKCEAKSVSGSIVTLDCKRASKLSVGDSVKVKENKKKAIEGC